MFSKQISYGENYSLKQLICIKLYIYNTRCIFLIVKYHNCKAVLSKREVFS